MSKNLKTHSLQRGRSRVPISSVTLKFSFQCIFPFPEIKVKKLKEDKNQTVINFHLLEKIFFSTELLNANYFSLKEQLVWFLLNSFFDSTLLVFKSEMQYCLLFEYFITTYQTHTTHIKISEAICQCKFVSQQMLFFVPFPISFHGPAHFGARKDLSNQVLNLQFSLQQDRLCRKPPHNHFFINPLGI